jgi:outer membrane protein OmpA-like peptidoglycan-associated protein
MLGSGVQKITMNKPYTIDFDGLDGLYELAPSISIQNDIKKTDNSPLLAVHKNNDKKQSSSKKPYPLLLGLSLLAMGALFAYLGKDDAYKDTPKVEPLIELKDQSLVVSTSEVLAKETEIQTVKEEKEILLHKIQNTQEQIAAGAEKINNLSKPLVTASNNDGADRVLTVDSSNETHTINADNLNPSDINSPSQTAQNKEENGSISITKKETFDTTLEKNLSDKTESNSNPSKLNQNNNLNQSVKQQTAVVDTIAKADTFNPVKETDKINNYTLRFNFNKAAIDLPSTEVEKLETFLQQCPDKIQVIGHTCNLGPFESNQAIGLIRAEKVKDLLINMGFSIDRIKVINAGQKEPIASNKTYAGRVLNRRVVINCFNH